MCHILSGVFMSQYVITLFSLKMNNLIQWFKALLIWETD